MINEIKKSFRLIPYGYGVKMNLICGVIFFLIGLAELSTGSQLAVFSASVFIILGPIVCLQLASTLLYSGIVASSPRRRVVEIGLGDAVSAGATLIGYLVVTGYTFLNREMIENPMENLILASICMAVSVIYFGVAFKIYLIGSILYFISIIGAFGLEIAFFEITEIEFSFANASVISFLIVVLGVVLSSVLRRLLYKRRLSPMACGAALRKAMQL